MIPQTIHMIWLGSRIPDQFLINFRKWATLNPTWEMRLWSEPPEGMYNRDLYDTAERYVRPDAVWQFRADLMRYQILYTYGGFYADVDTVPLRPLGNLFDDRTEFAVMEDFDWIGNTYLASEPGTFLFEELIEQQISNCGWPNRAAGVVSGPQYLTPIWQGLRGHVETRTELWFPYSYRDVKRGGDSCVSPSPDCYAIHTWNHQRTKGKK